MVCGSDDEMCIPIRKFIYIKLSKWQLKEVSEKFQNILLEKRMKRKLKN